VVNLWNSPPQKAVEAKPLNILKVEIDRFLAHKGVGSMGGMRECGVEIEDQP